MSNPAASPAIPLAVRFDGVGHRFGRRILYAQLSFTVAAGEALVICGANGSGKSTLLRIVAGLLQPTTGSVIIERDGQPLPRAAWRAAVGYLSPETMPYRPLTVRENLDFFARVRGLAGWSDELVEELGLTARLDDPVSALSSGYVQRVKLAVALLHEPPVLLLDEPGVTLDDEGQRRVGEVVARQRQRGLCLLAANDPRDVAYGTRIMRLGG